MKKIWIVSLLFMLVAILLWGCNSENDSSKQSDNGDSEQREDSTDTNIDDGTEKMSISMMIPSWGEPGPDNEHPIVQNLNKELNIELDVEWVSGPNYTEKISVLAASNSLPDVFRVSTTDFQSLRGKNVFMDVKPYLSNYSNLTEHLPEEAWQQLNPEDQYVGIPYYSIPHLFSLAIREDWLENLGMDMPQTIDDFYEVAKAFATQDPDGNGKNDTIGFSIVVQPNGQFENHAFLQGAFGLGNEWMLKDDVLIPMQAQAEELKDFIGFLRKAYSEGVLDQDFMLQDPPDMKQKFLSGTLGIAQVNPNEVYRTDLPKIQENFPEAKVSQLLPPEGPTGLRATDTEPMAPHKVVINDKIDEKKKQRILDLLDYMLSDEGYNLIKNGIEDIHYEQVNGTYEQIETNDSPFEFSVSFFRRAENGIQLRVYHDEDYKKNVEEWLNNNDEFSWSNPALGLDVETEVFQNVNFTTLNSKWMSTIVRVITGDLPIESVDDAVEEWLKSGGEQLIEEVNELYELRNND